MSKSSILAFCSIALAGTLALASQTPQLTVIYQNVVSLNVPNTTNYYGPYWVTNASIAAYHGTTLTNLLTTTGSAYTAIVYRASGAQGLILDLTSYGQPVESQVAQFQLGDVIPFPDGIADTNQPPVGFVAAQVGNNPSAYYMSTNPSGAVIYLPDLHQVVAAAGGNVTITWQTTGGVIQVVYTISDVPRDRPARVFWTESPYNAPAVSLSANNGQQEVFAAIHYNNIVRRPTLSVTSNLDAQGNWAITTQLLNGVWIDGDGASKVIRAVGVEGSALLEYYSDGNYNHSLGVQPIQVLPPQHIEQEVSLGQRLLPQDLYYGTTDLIPNITAGAGTDGKVYQVGIQGPKLNWVYGVRKSVGNPWDVEIYWEHMDNRGVTWPFEIDWYEIDWPASPQRFVISGQPPAGTPILVPSTYTVQVPFQEPDNNTRLSSDQQFLSMSQEGKALIQYSTESNVWFDVLQAVRHNDPHEFNLEPRYWPIGREIKPFSVNSFGVQFNGSNTYASRRYVETAPSNFTIEITFRTTNTQGGKLIGFGDKMDGASSSFDRHIYMDNSGRLYFGMYATSAHVIVTSNVLNDGEWHHAAATYAQGAMRFYVDGVLVGTNYAAVVPFNAGNSGYWRVGYDTLSSGWPGTKTSPYFAGLLDEIRIWDRALQEQVITNIMLQPLSGKEPGLTTCYPFTDGKGDLVTDLVAHKPLQLAGGFAWVAGFPMSGSQENDSDAAWMDFPGYVYERYGNSYNFDLYQYPSSTLSIAESHIFPVHSNGMLEVWWANHSANEDMPEMVYYPSRVERYIGHWPDLRTVPQIAIAGGRGSAGASDVFALTNLALTVSNNNWALEFLSTDYAAAGSGAALQLQSNFTLEGWVYLNATGARQALIAKGNYEYNFGLSSNKLYYYDGSRSNFYYSSLALTAGQWSHAAVSFSYEDQKVAFYINGGCVGRFPVAGGGTTARHAVAHSGTGMLALARAGQVADSYYQGRLDEVRIWNVARSREEIAFDMAMNSGDPEAGLLAYYCFEEGVSNALSDRSGNNNTATNVGAAWVNIGAQSNRNLVVVNEYVDSGVMFASSADAAVYYQNDPSLPGFNPNEEHALVLGGVAYALRSDLNQPGNANSSPPFVLMQYSENGAPAMRLFAVVPTNLFFPAFTNGLTAGYLVQPPMPMAAMPYANNTSNLCTSGPGWRDRKLEWWAKAAGNDGGLTNLVMHFWYAFQGSFFFPTLTTQPAEDTLVPWMSGGNTGAPIDYTYSIVWPSDVPTLKLAETLYVSPANSGLPDIRGQLSVDVVYQQSHENRSLDSVTLIDPLVRRGATLDLAVVQQMEAAGLASRQSPGTTYTFPGAPPSLQQRLIFDPNQPTDLRLSVVGEYVETLTDGYLLLNLIEAYEYNDVLNLANDLPYAIASQWQTAVGLLPRTPKTLAANEAFVKPALSAGLGTGVGYVTVAFNNATNPAMVPTALPISLSIFRVITNLYDGAVEVVASEDPLDEKLTLRQKADFGGQAGQFYFQWRTLPPTAQGMPPTNTPPEQWLAWSEGQAQVGITIEGAGVSTLVDNYFIARHHSLDTNCPAGTNTWSQWVLGFGPGWVQRAMNGITPFEQRLHDMTEYGVDTSADMISQAGAPYSGPVALNMANIDDYGLIQIYETILGRARMLSIDSGISYDAADSTLMLAAGRLRDLYMVLGNEAYADAQDPTIAFGTENGQYGAFATSIFCFQNQMASLLDEELALLRGRDSTILPPPTQGPVFNRLPWNLTRDQTGGEVAYALNYNLFGDPGTEDPVTDPEDAKAAYPQGHGDAWGHYLSAIQGYYQLLRSAYFDWVPGIGSMILGGSGDLIMSVDYCDERKFAEIAAARARAGADIVNKTYRKFYSADPESQFQGYEDEDSSRAWGVADWATRVGQAAYIDWAMANALLPATAASPSQNWALSFTNSGAYAGLGTHTLVDGSEMTLELWVQSIALSNSVLFGGSTTEWDGTPRTNLFAMLADGRVAWYSQHDRQTLYSKTVVGDGRWHQVGFVYANASSGPERRLHVDGALEAKTPTYDIYWHNWVWSLGAFQSQQGGPLSGFFNGNLDEVRIWNRALSDADMLANLNHVLKGNEPGLISYYPALDGTGTVLHDQCGANHGDMINLGWVTPANLLPFTNALSVKGFLATVAQTNRLNHDGSYSLEAWVNYAGGGTNVSIFDKTTTNLSQYQMRLNPASNAILGACGNKSGASVAPFLSRRIPSNRWVHVALSVSYSPSNNLTAQTMYLNGLLEGSGTVTGKTTNVAGALLLGTNWPGMLNELRIWNYPRSGMEIARDFRTSLLGTESGLIAAYNANAISTNQLLDIGTNSLHGRRGTNVSVVAFSSPVPPAPAADGGGASYPGILEIDRSTVPELYEIAANARSVQTELDGADQGLNPLGLARDTIPFDIAPAEIDLGKTHFEQIYERARAALNNAVEVFDYAQGATLKLRAQADSMYNLATAIAQSELDFHDQLIAIFGYPYSDDIGPSGSYPQGYDGPDLINYNILDLDALIGTAPTGQPVQLVLKNLEFVAPEAGTEAARKYTDYILDSEPLPGSTNAYEYADYIAKGCTVTVYIAQNGLQVKPPTWTGRRQAQGSIQIALSAYIQAYYQLKQAVAQYASLQAGLQKDFDHLLSTVRRSDGEWEAQDDRTDDIKLFAGLVAGLEEFKELGNAIIESGMQIAKQTCKAVPQLVAGAAGIASPVAVSVVMPGEIGGIGITIMNWAKILGNWAVNSTITALKVSEEAAGADFANLLATNGYNSTITWAARDFQQSLSQQQVQQAQIFQQIQNLSQMEESYIALIAQGQRLITQRAQTRARAGKQIQYARYFDMAFRIFRNEQLQKYSSAFDLAARYTYLAAKAYDYETGLLSSDASRAAGTRFLSDVVRARTIGRVNQGEPQVGGPAGDPGLADILARMKANWNVLETRLGFNNPETEISRFSLRTELLRIALTSSGDATWRNALNSQYRVDNLYDLSEFRKYCKPFSSTTNREPALVIPFETVIMSRKNFFSHDLAGGDGAYDAAYAATKIRSMGVWFFNYNNTYNTNSSGGGLASEPHVYLVPVGEDVQRSPTDVESLRVYSVVDQAMPVPYPLSQADLANPEWIAIHDSLSGSLADIRRYTPLRAYFENDANKYTQDDGYIDPAQMIGNARLVGRSVWNTRWLLIVPGSTLLANPDEGLERFIFGAGAGAGPSQRDGNGVKDIRILFHTYSAPGE